MSFRGEADLQRHFIDCDKHPGHEMFTPVSTFSVRDLPEGYQDPDIVAYIRAQADLTVRVVSRYTSSDRPDNYAFSGIKGETFLRTGTGFIQYVYKCEGRTDKPCPCPECKNSDAPRAQWAKVKIRTATHVVFDDTEAKHSVAELFYDNHEDLKNGKIKTVFGDNVCFGAIRGDWCDMRCVTHDLDLCDYIKDAWGRWRWLESKVNEKFRGDEHRLSVVVSHPHGCNKQVSVGRWADRVVVGGSKGWESSVYSYDTPTCPGSSGAPVWLLGKVKWGGFFGRHPHSGRPLEGLNLSATGLDRTS
ncbi:uncharacterized protein LOC101857261 [Aplysia californica]|uniref:Uncharacterized protein LOC101857261 n=1 Tax=Aplysia californica TaxID=6500 RepID=A0ABM1VWI0_APLCA|nr:uncharacterized protein LOC101857261 [Aplysia californica]